jgi:hypothetical protein
MPFLMTSMLIGLAAVSIPIIIHLLHRQRTTPVQWGAMQFLQESPLQLKRRKKVDHWLLMLLRMAVIALLVMALARPLLIEGQYNPLSSNLATDIGVVVDRSLSTGRRSGDATAYDRGVAAVAELAKTMRPNDTLTVVLAEHRPQPQSIRLAPARAAEAANKLKEMGPGMSDASIPDAVQAARELIAEGRNARKMILVVSDEQRNNWGIDNNSAWQLALGERAAGGAGDRGVKMYALGVTPDNTASDVAVGDVAITPSLVGLNRPATVTATITNSGPAPVKGVHVQMHVDGKLTDARPLDDLPAGEARTVRFDHTFAEPGSHHVKIRADVTDALEADNEAYVAANVWERLPVLVIDGQLTSAGDFRSSQFLRAAMQPVEASQDDKTLVQPEIVSVTDASAKDLDRFAVVVVNDAPGLPTELLNRLAAYARGGRAVWFIFGPRAEQSFIARDLGEAGLFLAAVKGRHLPGDAVAAAGAPPGATTNPAGGGAGIEVKDPRNPMVQLITAAERNTLAGAVTRGWWSIVPESNDARVVLATQTGDPLVIERPIGNSGGRVALWLTSVDAKWNNWPVMPNFVPLVNETLYHLASGQTRGLENRRLNAGQEIVWAGQPLPVEGGPAAPPPDPSAKAAPPPPPVPVVQRITVARPDGSTAEVSPRTSNGRQVLSYNDTFLPGLYALRFDKTEVPQPVYYGVGIDRRELDATALAAGDHKWLADRGYLERRLENPGELASAVGAVNKGSELWPILAVVLLASLLFETFMTWRLMRHQNQVDVAASGLPGAVAAA